MDLKFTKEVEELIAEQDRYFDNMKSFLRRDEMMRYMENQLHHTMTKNYFHRLVSDIKSYREKLTN